MDIHTPQCLNMGAISSWRNDHEKAHYDWDYRRCHVVDCDAPLASVVAKEGGYYRPALYGGYLGYRIARRVAIHRARWR
jgi:hypothetical protein